MQDGDAGQVFRRADAGPPKFLLWPASKMEKAGFKVAIGHVLPEEVGEVGA